MLFILLVLAASLLLLSVALMLVAFLVALVDYLLGGGPAATTVGSNADSHAEAVHIASFADCSKTGEPFDFHPAPR
jgi:hypothetical protein